MDNMEASCVFYVKVGTFTHLEQSKISLMTVKKSGIVTLAIQHDMIVSVVAGKRLPPLQSHAFKWVHDLVRVISALHYAIEKVEKSSLEGIRDDSDRQITYLSSSHLFPSSLFCFLVLANQLSRCGYSLPTLLETKPPFW